MLKKVGIIFIGGIQHIIFGGLILPSIATVDSKGRIVLPKDIREKYGIQPGFKVIIEDKGEGEILIRIIKNDPSLELAKLLGDFTFTRKDRVEAEKLLVKEVR